MSRPSPLASPLRRQVFVGRSAVEKGLLTPAQLRSTATRRVLHGVYADPVLPTDHGTRIAAAALVLPGLVVIAGRSAAWLHGVRLARPDDPVEVMADAGVRRHARGRISVHTGSIPEEDSQLLGGLRVTTASRTCVDIARWHDEVDAVCLIDAVLAARLAGRGDLDRQLARSSGRGLTKGRRTVALADGRAQSPPESVVRVRLIRAGIPTPEPQLEVWNGATFVARVDLGWRQARVALEYDGAWHGDSGQLGRDRRRLNRLVAAGWTVIHVTAADLRDLTAVIVQVRTARRSAA